MSQARRRKKNETSMLSDTEKQLATDAHRQGMPTFLLRLRSDAATAARATSWRPAYRHD